MPIPVLLLLCLVTTLPAAAETFTLDDGRTFTGEYDEAEQRLYTTVDGKATSFLVAKDQIVERAPVGRKSPVLVVKMGPSTKPEPKPASAKDEPATPAAGAAGDEGTAQPAGEASQAELAHAAKIRAAAKLEAESAKATRDAIAARAERDERLRIAKKLWPEFRRRAEAHGIATSPVPARTLMVLPGTTTSNRASFEAMQDSDKASARAVELDAMAEAKARQAAALRHEAAAMLAAPTEATEPTEPTEPTKPTN